ncbi:hypothetical protein MRX96_008353 [Rhipicephalus microplus]
MRLERRPGVLCLRETANSSMNGHHPRAAPEDAQSRTESAPASPVGAIGRKCRHIREAVGNPLRVLVQAAPKEAFADAQGSPLPKVPVSAGE